jgi:hypothetical protein
MEHAGRRRSDYAPHTNPPTSWHGRHRRCENQPATNDPHATAAAKRHPLHEWQHDLSSDAINPHEHPPTEQGDELFISATQFLTDATKLLASDATKLLASTTKLLASTTKLLASDAEQRTLSPAIIL